MAVRIVSRYQNSLQNHRTGQKRMYKNRREQKTEVEAAGGRASKSNWFQKSGATNLLRVPATPASGLAKAMEAALGRTAAPTGLRANVAEEPGRSVKTWLVKSNQFPRKSCGRKLCPWLAREEDCQERCYLEGVTCLARCRRCRQRQVQEEREFVDQCYIGETHRSVVTRSETHFSLYKPGAGEVGGAVRAGQGHEGGGRGEDEEKEGSWMKEHTVIFQWGVFSTDKMSDYEFIVLTNTERF